MLFIKLAYKNVKAYWKHSFASILAISSGFISICLFQGYVDDLSRLFHESISKVKMNGDIIIENKNLKSIDGKSNPFKYLITKEHQQKFIEIFEMNPNLVENYVPFLSISGIVSNGPKSTIFIGLGYDVIKGAKMRTSKYEWNTFFGIPLHQTTDSESVLFGGNLAKLLECDFNNDQSFNSKSGTWLIEENRPFHCKNSLFQVSANTVHDQFNAINLNLTGIIDGSYKEIDSKYLMMSLDNAHKLFDTDGVSYYSVRLAKGASFKKFTKLLNDKFGNDINTYNVNKWEQHPFGDIYNRNMSLFAIFRNFVLTIIVFVCGLSVFNTMLKIVVERHREIGTLRSFGFSKKHIRNIFISEGILISFFGVSLGIVSSLLITLILNKSGFVYKAGMLTRPVSFLIAPSFSLYLVSALVMVVISIGATYWALLTVQNKKIVECLSYA
jgi:putative ABC transport system permease protein